MNCKKCNQELEPGLPFCPACGTDNSVQDKPKKQLWKPILAIVCVVVLAVGIAAAVYMGINSGFTAGDSVTAKASYTGTDKEVLGAADTVIARAGDLELTNSELQVIYWSMVYDFLNYYGDYASYYVDFTKPLDEQVFDSTSGLTFQQYFLDLALQSWLRYEVLCVEAGKAGVELDAETADYIDGLYENIKSQLETYGFESVEAMIATDFGVGGTFEDYASYLHSYYLGNQYYEQMYNALEFSDEEIEAYYNENAEYLEYYGYGKDAGDVVDVRHILIRPNDDESATDYTDAEWEACYDEAERILNLWLDGEATEESFAELANTYSADSDGTDGGLYTGITSSTNFVEPFLSWCMDESRQVGDYGIVQTTYGYHIMYFSAGEALWYDASHYYLASDTMNELMNQQEANYPLEVDYSKIVLGEVALS